MTTVDFLSAVIFARVLSARSANVLNDLKSQQLQQYQVLLVISKLNGLQSAQKKFSRPNSMKL
jgi:hypothetical protein